MTSLRTLALGLLAAAPAWAQAPAQEERPAEPERPMSLRELMRDPEDGAFDVSLWLLQASGFMPIPFVITEPALGLGGGVALAFIHGKLIPDEEGRDKVHGQPSATALIGGGTENGSWFAGGAHLGSAFDDHLRYEVAAVRADANLGYFVDDQEFDFNIEADVLRGSLKTRVGDSPWFLGADAQYVGSTSRFDVGGTIPGLPTDLDIADTGLGVEVSYDTLDSFLVPNLGQQLRLRVRTFDDSFGGDFDYWSYEARLRSFHALSDDLALAVGLRGAFVDGGTPFYARPFVQLRGIPVLRYQGDQVADGQVELRYDFLPRYSVVGFLGTGVALNDVGALEDHTDIWAGGVGLRYLVARLLNLRAGLDVAVGPETTAVYIAVGSGV